MKPARKFNTQGRIGKQVGGVGLLIVMRMGEERGCSVKQKESR
jgi:hypothetical protein